jgi:hypothetical protein
LRPHAREVVEDTRSHVKVREVLYQGTTSVVPQVVKKPSSAASQRCPKTVADQRRLACIE